MPDNEVTISTTAFDFHYVTKTTGEIDGFSFFQQTEDALNDIGKLAQEAYNSTVVSAEQVQQALDTANTANSNASNALTVANGAQNSVATLSITVTQIGQNAQLALTTSQSAQNAANSAVNAANSARDEAEGAKEAAQSAQAQAQQSAIAAASSASAAATAQSQAETAQNQAETAQNNAQQALSSAQAAEQNVNQAIAQANLVHAYDGTLTPGGTVAIADLSPSSGKTNDLVIDSTGTIYTIMGVNSGTASLGDTGAILTGFISYAQEQTLTEDQQTQSLTNQGVIQAITELIQENGGTVPTSTQTASVQSLSAEETNPWAEYD